jgi:phosphomannomutase
LVCSFKSIEILFSFSDLVCDKDGLSAAAVFIEMANFMYAKNLTISEYYESIEDKYGVFISYNSYVLCYDQQKTDKIFMRLRNKDNLESTSIKNQYWTHCNGVAITSIKDVTFGYDSSVTNSLSDLPMTPDSHMIMYGFDNGVSMTLRTSGTEPKIKFYTEIEGVIQQRSELEIILRTFVDAAVNEMLQIDENNLTLA